MRLIDADALSDKMKAYFNVHNGMIPSAPAVAILSAIDEARTFSLSNSCRCYCNTGEYIRMIAAELTSADVLHCIGLNDDRPYKRNGKRYYKPYRNYFSSNIQLTSWEELIEQGYAAKDEGKRGVTYWLTRTGLDWLGKAIGVVIHSPED